MKNKLLLAMVLLCLVTLAAALSWTRVSAQGPTNTGPGSAIYLDRQWHSIPPNTTLWYLFDYNGDRSMIDLTLVDGLRNKLQFNVYTPDQINPTNIGNPIGRGSTSLVNCDTGKCLTNDLNWSGNFTGGATFFIELINPNPVGASFLLDYKGSGVTVRIPTPAPAVLPSATAPRTASPTPNVMQTVMIPAIGTLRAPVTTTAIVTTTVPVTPTAEVTPQPTVTSTLPIAPTPTLFCAPSGAPTCIPSGAATPPAAVPTQEQTPSPAFTPTPVNAWWTDAYWVMDSRMRTIPAFSGRWLAFEYAGDRSKVEIRIPGGNEMRLAFRLYTPDQAGRYETEDKPTGEGTAGLVACDSGKCPSNDLVWAGDFAVGGPYFIQVINNNPTPKTYQIIIIGSGVVLGR